jgi:histidinol phosphatase-like enzyme (inositol monophosphatase family)
MRGERLTTEKNAHHGGTAASGGAGMARAAGMPGIADPRLAAAVDAARAAGEVAGRHFGTAIDVEWKTTASGRSPVTVADREAETAARKVLESLFPEHGFLGEEFGEDGARTARWIIDPIDGTDNFIRRIPLFGSLVALEEDGRITAAAAFRPIVGEMVWALAGGGAYLNGRQLRVSERTTLDEALVVHSSVGQFVRSGIGRAGSDERMSGIDRLLAASRRDRSFGDYTGYILVAAGLAEAMIDGRAAPWDLAAPRLIVEEAGGSLTALDGSDSIYGGGAIATNGALHRTVLALLGTG